MQINKLFASLVAFLGLLILYNTGSVYAQEKPEDAIQNRTRIEVAGTSVKLTLPDVFVFDQSQAAYIYAGASASITIKELNGTAYNSVIKGITKSYIESQGMKLVESQDVTTNTGKKAKQFIVSFSVPNPEKGSPVDFERIIFFTGNDNKTVWVTVNYPLITKGVLGDVLRSSILSVEF
jgi:hypothetical protein